MLGQKWDEEKEIKSVTYSQDFFFKYNDGFQDFLNNYQLSYIKKKELEYLNICQGIKFLDIGHGRGEMLYHCAKLGARCYGIDYSDEAIKIGKEILKDSANVSIFQADCADLPFKDNTFERVLLGDVIEHVSFQKGIRVVKEAVRVLSPGGIFLIHTSPNRLFMKIVYPVLIRMVKGKKRQDIIKQVNMQNKVHLQEYDYFTLKKLAKAAGIETCIWIDKDLTRGKTFRHFQDLSRRQKFFLKSIAPLEKFCVFPFRLILGNDIWLKYIKPYKSMQHALIA